MPAYWFWYERARRRTEYRQVGGREDAQNQINNYGAWESFHFYKELPSANEAEALRAEITSKFTAVATGYAPLFEIGSFPLTTIPPGPEHPMGPYGISAVFMDLPWFGTFYPGFTGQRRATTWNQPFTNGGEALRFAAKKIYEMGRDPHGYSNIPAVWVNPDERWHIRSPMAEITGQPNPENYATVKNFDPSSLGVTCGNCGFYGHRRSECTKPAKAHDRVGIEVEGRWVDLRAAQAMAVELTGSAGYQDGSVYRDPILRADPWEFQTKPGSLKAALEQLIRLYPDSADEKCGMHVHVSFSAADTGLLHSEDFFNFFKARWEAWGATNNIAEGSEFWERLRGKNSFCLPPKVERNMLSMDRYSQLNFSAWNEHTTVECRLLPMFRNQSLSVSAITELLAIYEDYFAQDFGPKLHTEAVALPGVEVVPWVEKKEYEVPTTFAVRYNHSIELNELAPVAPGMRRVALPTGLVMGGKTASTASDFLLPQAKAKTR